MSDFANHLAKVAGADWQEFQEADDMFAPCELEDGVYLCRCMHVRCGFDKNGDCLVRINFEVTEGEGAGEKFTKFHSLNNRGNRTIANGLKFLGIDLMRLGAPVEQCKAANEMEVICTRLSKDRPLVKVRYGNPEQIGWSPNIDIQALVEPPQWEQDEKTSGADPMAQKEPAAEPPAAEPEPEKKKRRRRKKKEETPPPPPPEPEPELEDDDGGEDVIIPEIGDLADCAPEGRGRPSKVAVIAVNEETETCDVRRVSDGFEFKDVPFARLDLDEIPF